MEPLLEVKNLTKTFEENRGGKGLFLPRKEWKKKGLTAVNQVSFSLYPGEILGIAGASGAGKSTVARAVTRLLDVTSGEIFFHGKEITRAEGKARDEVYQHMQMVFQSPEASFHPRHTLGYSIGESFRNRGYSRKEAQKEAGKLLRVCGLPESLAFRYPREVSGGQCQRAAIARALSREPELLVCDEATSALDVMAQKKIVDLLRKLRQEYKMACLFICHDLALVQSLCDRVLIMQDGRIAEEGRTEDVLQNPKSSAARALLEAVI